MRRATSVRAASPSLVPIRPLGAVALDLGQLVAIDREVGLGIAGKAILALHAQRPEHRQYGGAGHQGEGGPEQH